MNRPSHWLLAFLIVVGAATLGSGRLESWLTGSPEPGQTGQDSSASGVERKPSLDVAADIANPETGRSTVAPGRIVGRVIDRFGWPMAGVDVRVVGDRLGVRTDRGGCFELRTDGLGVRSVRFSTADQVIVEELACAGFQRTVVLPDPTPWEAGVLPPNDVLSPPKLAGDTALQLRSGAPVANAWVGVRETGAIARTNDRGHARLPLRSDDSVTLVAWNAAGGAARTESTRPNRRYGIIPLPGMVLDKGYVFSGRLCDENGEPVPTPVRLIEGRVVREVDPDVDGRFAFEGLVGGSYEVEVLPYRGILGFKRRVEVLQNREEEITLERDRPLQLQVVDRQKNALTGFHVLARDNDNRRAHVVTDRRGAAVVRGLGAGNLEFEVRNPKLEPLRVESWAQAQRLLVVAAP